MRGKSSTFFPSPFLGMPTRLTHSPPLMGGDKGEGEICGQVYGQRGQDVLITRADLHMGHKDG